MIPTFLHTKSQICHVSSNACNRVTSLKFGTHIKVAIAKLSCTFYAKIVISRAAAAFENIVPFHHTKRALK
jgi:hypothetical protein